MLINKLKTLLVKIQDEGDARSNHLATSALELLEKVDLNDELACILMTMDVPEMRLKDVFWLMRNLHFRNQEHPNFKKAMAIIKERAKHLTTGA